MTLRGGALGVVGAAIVALLFIASYAGALHDPRPHDVPVAVAAQVPQRLAQRLDASPAVAVRRAASPAAAQRQVDRREAYGAIVPAPGGRGLVLVTSPAGSAAVADLLQQRLVPQLRRATPQVRVRTAHALSTTDARGLVGFYTVVGWVVAGYLCATLFGLVFGTRPDRRGTILRLGGLVALGAIVGIAGGAIAYAIAGWDHGLGWIMLAGALTAMAVGACTIALQSLLGIAGTGVAILLFVVLGNPSAGGPYPGELLPGFWRVLGPILPPGAATAAVRDAAYFPAAPIGGRLLVLAAWLVGGALLAFALARRGGGAHPDLSSRPLSGAATA